MLQLARRAQGSFAESRGKFFLACAGTEWFSSSSPAEGLGRAIFSAFLFGAIHLGSLDQRVAEQQQQQQQPQQQQQRRTRVRGRTRLALGHLRQTLAGASPRLTGAAQ